MKLNLEAKTPSEKRIKDYLEENASDVLANKIIKGVKIEKDGKTLINKKTLATFMKYATQEARKTVESGASSACIEDDVVFGWAIHYFEEDSIEGELFNEDNTPYNPPKPVIPTVIPKKVEPPASNPQMSLFEMMEQEQVDLDTGEIKDDLPEEDFDLTEEKMRAFDGDMEEPTIEEDEPEDYLKDELIFIKEMFGSLVEVKL